MKLLLFLDYFFLIFHAAFVLFFLTGWSMRLTRRVHLTATLLTAGSWFFLGYFYGWGYCFCTDWHWRVRLKLGYSDMPASYVKFLLDRLTGLDWNAALVDACAFVFFLIGAGLSGYFNWRDRRKS